MMGAAQSWLVRYGSRLFALLVVLALYALAQPPAFSDTDRQALATRFRFTAHPLPELAGPAKQEVRPVHPSLRRIEAWISAVGAAAALHDLDGDGLPNDVCYVDTRTNQVIVAPVPGMGERYVPFTLDATPLNYASETMAPMGCLPGHMTESALADILVYYWGRSPIAFLRKGSGPLGPAAFVPQEVVPEHPRWFTNSAMFADLTGSGHADLVIANYYPDGARILDTRADGTEQMQHSMSRAYNGGGKHFLLWSSAAQGPEPVVQFTEAKVALNNQVAHGWTLGLGAADLNGDQLPELYFANDFGPDQLLLNQSTPGDLRFLPLYGQKMLTSPNSKVLGRDSFKGMGVDFGDIDGNGKLAIVVSNITESYALQESNFLWVDTGEPFRIQDQIAPFVDRSEARGLARSGWGWDTKFADFDNSGKLAVVQATGFMSGPVDHWPELQELAMANDELLSDPRIWPRFGPGDGLSAQGHNPFFVQGGDGNYVDIARELGLEPSDRSYVSRGIAIADVDGSGRLSFLVANQWAPSVFYRNESPTKNSFLGLHIRYSVGPAPSVEVAPGRSDKASPSRPAIGASAIVTLPDGRRMAAQVDGGNGHSGKRSPDLHFGLGPLAPTTPIKVEIRWRDGAADPRDVTLTLTPGWYTVRLGPRGVS